jgi:hypothetical protein
MSIVFYEPHKLTVLAMCDLRSRFAIFARLPTSQDLLQLEVSDAFPGILLVSIVTFVCLLLLIVSIARDLRDSWDDVTPDPEELHEFALKYKEVYETSPPRDILTTRRLAYYRLYLLGTSAKGADRSKTDDRRVGGFHLLMRRWGFEYRQTNSPLSAIFKPLLYEGSRMVRSKRIVLLWMSILVSFSCK